MIRELYVFDSNDGSSSPLLIGHIQKRAHNNDGVEGLVQSMAFFLARSKVGTDFERMVMPTFSVFYCTVKTYSLFVITNVPESTEKIRTTMKKLRALIQRYTMGGKPTPEVSEKMRSDMKDALQETLKVVFVGPGAVGKSSCRMLLNYEDPPFIHNPTMGPVFSNLEDDVIIWDTPGQEGFETMWPKLVLDSDVVVIVCDSQRENLGKVADIVQQCRAWAPNAKMIAIANKQDRADALPPEDVEAYLQIPTYPLVAIDMRNRETLACAIEDALSGDER